MREMKKFRGLEIDSTLSPADNPTEPNREKFFAALICMTESSRVTHHSGGKFDK
jgi:hypothetical protein